MELIQRVLIVGSLNSVDYLIDHKLIIRFDELLTSVFLYLRIHELLKYKLQIFYKFEINSEYYVIFNLELSILLHSKYCQSPV